MSKTVARTIQRRKRRKHFHCCGGFKMPETAGGYAKKPKSGQQNRP